MKEEAFWAAGLLVAVIVTAALVNRVRPAHRPRIRRVVIIFVLYAVAAIAHAVLETLGSSTWVHRAAFAAELLQGLNVVSIGTTLATSVVLPATGIVLPMIVTDLLVGLGYFIATLAVLDRHGYDAKSVLATGAVFSAVLAISLQSTLGNVLGGIALQLDGSIHEGDWIQLENGKQGRVRAVRWRHTVVETRDWSTIIVPNSALLQGQIMILGKRDGRDVPQRMWVWFNVDFRFPPPKVIETVLEALHGSPIEGVASDPPPSCVCMDFTKDMRESFATYAVRYWLTDLAADDPTSSRVRGRVFTALKRANIPLALPGSRLWLQMDDESHVASARKRETLQRVKSLKLVPLFRSFADAELETLAEGMSHVVYCAGETITRQGAVAHWLYVLTRGSADIITSFDPDGPGPLPAESKTVAKIEAPDVFGEMGLMTGAPRTANVVATTDVECYRLDKSTFEGVLAKRPEIANELSDKLANRRVELFAARDGLDGAARTARKASERERILDDIKRFFGL